MRVSWHERVIFGFQSSSHRICYIFTFPPKMGAVSWGRWRGNGPKTYLLSHNPINNEEALASWWRQLAPAHSAPGWKLFDVERSPLTIFLFYALPLKAERWLFCSRHRVSEHQKCRFWGWKKKGKYDRSWLHWLRQSAKSPAAALGLEWWLRALDESLSQNEFGLRLYRVNHTTKKKQHGKRES